jgi:4-hydroxy-4-methyl-2-oxoglutarate aldolase
VIVVPAEVADEVAIHARAILLADMRARRKHYDALGMKPDSSVDFDAVERYYAEL